MSAGLKILQFIKLASSNMPANIWLNGSFGEAKTAE